MKIAIFVPSWPPGASANGIVTYAAQIIPVLRQLGHEVFVLTPKCTAKTADPYTIDLNAIETRRSPLSRLASRVLKSSSLIDDFGKKLVSTISMLTERHNIDVVEIEESFGWASGIARAKIVPVVVRLHGPWFLNGSFDDSPSPASRARIEAEGLGIRAATMITAPSADVLSNVRTHYNLRLDSARVIPNPMEVDADAADWQAGTCNPNRMLYVGRFDRRKGGDIVLRAFAKLAELYPDLRLSFVGPDAGVNESGERLSFNQFVRRNIPDFCWSRIDYRGQLSHEDVMALRNEHLFTIVASQFEILPYAVLEAMALGCPIIASNVGGIPELITDHETGLLFTSQNVEELTSACAKLLDDHALASALGAQAKRHCTERFSAQRIALETISAYRASIAAFRSPDI
jgi:glycosyltransferase involved in cell wall biosynthesis